MLSPFQISRLAEFIRLSVKDHPILVGDISEKHLSQRMEPWEQALSNAITACPSLPSYDFIKNNESELLEFLVEYFTLEEKNE